MFGHGLIAPQVHGQKRSEVLAENLANQIKSMDSYLPQYRNRVDKLLNMTAMEKLDLSFCPVSNTVIE